MGPFRLLACLLGVEMEASQEVGMAYVAASYSCFFVSVCPASSDKPFQRRHPILAFAKNGSAFFVCWASFLTFTAPNVLHLRIKKKESYTNNVSRG